MEQTRKTFSALSIPSLIFRSFQSDTQFLQTRVQPGFDGVQIPAGDLADLPQGQLLIEAELDDSRTSKGSASTCLSRESSRGSGSS